MERGIQIDTSLWPVALHRVQPVIDVMDMEIYNEEMSGLLARNEVFASIVIVKGKGKLDRKGITIHGEWLKANAAEIKKNWVSIAFVLPGEIYRLVLSALLLAAPAATEYKVFSDVQSAGRWTTEMLRRHNRTVPLLAQALARE